MITQGPAPRVFTIQMRAMMEAKEYQDRGTPEQAVVNREKIEIAAREVVAAARTTVRVAMYRTKAIEALAAALDKYDRAIGGDTA